MKIYYRSVWNENYTFVLMVLTVETCGVREGKKRGDLEKNFRLAKRDTQSQVAKFYQQK
jgi:hypothetical protein